jgi:hypothetical protein
VHIIRKNEGRAVNAPEESRTETVTVRLTPSEKRAVRGLAAIRGMPESDLVRTTPMEKIVQEFSRLVDAAESAADSWVVGEPE